VASGIGFKWRIVTPAFAAIAETDHDVAALLSQSEPLTRPTRVCLTLPFWLVPTGADKSADASPWACPENRRTRWGLHLIAWRPLAGAIDWGTLYLAQIVFRQRKRADIEIVVNYSVVQSKRHEPQLAHQSRVLRAIISIRLENMSGGDAD
jgi:hypothetical protein